jgi:hypothetical protein
MVVGTLLRSVAALHCCEATCKFLSERIASRVNLLSFLPLPPPTAPQHLPLVVQHICTAPAAQRQQGFFYRLLTKYRYPAVTVFTAVYRGYR